MGTLLDRDERVKIGFFIVVLLMLQGLIFYGINSKMVSNLNDKYIHQNTAIVGEIYSLDNNLAEAVIPIVTGKSMGNYEVGANIMARYSYDEGLNSKSNPLFENELDNFSLYLTIIVIGTMLLALTGIFYLINPVYKEILILTKRAEDIVENKFIKDINYNYKGSLDKFISKFNGMEDRIENSIGLLQDEKINLKNIINDISHQLKTPLMALSMYNEILSDHRNMDGEDVDNFISLSKEQLDRMGWLVKTLLKYARLESNVVQYNKEYFSLNNTIEESINPLLIKANEKNQKLIFNYKREIEYYHDRKWVGEAISNVIKNAIEHTENNGTIEVCLEETPITITIEIRDNGEGIKPSEIKKIFNRFHKGESSINPTSIGIGLCLSKSIIQSHNGDITVESRLGVGSIFYITFLKTIV